MEGFVKGDIVVLPFPFSDLTATKKRPAYVVSSVNDEVILCQITSRISTEECTITLTNSDFASGTLNITSMVKPQRIFTAENSIILRKIGHIKKEKIIEIEKQLVMILDLNLNSKR